MFKFAINEWLAPQPQPLPHSLGSETYRRRRLLLADAALFDRKPERESFRSKRGRRIANCNGLADALQDTRTMCAFAHSSGYLCDPFLARDSFTPNIISINSLYARCGRRLIDVHTHTHTHGQCKQQQWVYQRRTNITELCAAMMSTSLQPLWSHQSSETDRRNSTVIYRQRAHNHPSKRIQTTFSQVDAGTSVPVPVCSVER